MIEQSDFTGFQFREGELFCEDVPVRDIVEQFGSPLYIYSAATLRENLRRLQNAFGKVSPLICFSIKSCNNLHLIKLLVDAGAGIDVVSGGELYKAMQAGADPKKIVYAGVGKTRIEIEQALDAGIGWFNVESEEELQVLAAIAVQRNTTIRAALRVNPDLEDSRTHAKTFTAKKETKFGVAIADAPAVFARHRATPGLMLCGLHIHLGSPIHSADLYAAAVKKMLDLAAQLKESGIAIEMLDLGGGFMSCYGTQKLPEVEQHASVINPLLQSFADQGGQIVIEPGRSIAATSGVLIGQVLYRKSGGGKNFVILDTGMSHLLRPAMYDAFHFIWPVHPGVAAVPKWFTDEPGISHLQRVDIVGPVCEPGDCFAGDRLIPPVGQGDLMCIFSAGAYGMTMASHYNAIPNPPEVLVDGGSFRLVRRRENYEDLCAAERLD